MATQPPASPWRTPFRGMQIHAVPDADKAYDATGARLPWAYDLDPSASADTHIHREPLEKGPFGRSQRRSRSTLSRSRSKTAEPRREEERARAEQIASEDAVFGGLRRREVLGEVDGNANAVAGAQREVGLLQQLGGGVGEVEATEVMLYGFGEELQWAALDHFERVSGGVVLEDYDRQPPSARFDVARSLSRATGKRSFTRAALKKKNTFAGGMHWIKVTFDSRVAAELACARSPHIIKGHLVYAEPYLGRGPGRDEAILASQAGAQITDDVLPVSFSTNNLYAVQGSPDGSSTTATSATATTINPRPTQQQQRGGLQHSVSTPALPFGAPISPSSSTTLPRTNTNVLQPQSQRVAPQTPANTIRQRKLSGATPATVLPVTAALMPKPPKKSWSAWLGAGEVIGSTVPKKDDGTFDWEHAGTWWKVWWWVDWALGTDWVGAKAE